ncbi:alpha-hydroxy acid oxidase [Lysobacter sp. ESA13C]|uniref:alpha-hydroxy acid oxidase n=1 Tax=Lysobacter sp. ESA13C TaxID=2862676 RepID=UPI001CBC3963|nr:alpha-hydroxy acid oxidase [Lysobacter sp. ESA13C]
MDYVHDFRELRRSARRRLPGFAFDFIDGSAGREAAAARNVQAFADAEIHPDPLHPRARETRCALFNQSYAAPFGIAPMGGLGIIDGRADISIARAAAACDVPYVLSSVANTSLEDVARAAGRSPWLQLYCPQDRSLLFGLVDRAKDLGCPVLMLTVDMPMVGKRLRDIRNRLSIPFRWSARTVIDVVARPRWGLAQLVNGPLQFPNLRVPADDADDLATLMARQTGGIIDWELIATLRDRWPNALLIKGVQSASVARRAHQLGCDGVVVSNHGGRQLDGAAASLHSLSAVAAATRGGVTAIDSGLRCGEDVLKARLAGASVAFFGRPVAFAYAAGGQAAVEALLRILRHEYLCACVQAGEGSPDVQLLLRNELVPPAAS